MKAGFGDAASAPDLIRHARRRGCVGPLAFRIPAKIVDQNMSAACSRQLGDLRTDAAARARHDHNFSFEQLALRHRYSPEFGIVAYYLNKCNSSASLRAAARRTFPVAVRGSGRSKT